jgi:hypothetical protein
MRRRTLRYAVGLADAAEQLIARAGREVPDRAELLAVLIPAARTAARAARHLEWAAQVHAQAQAAEQAAGDAAAEATQEAVTAWLATTRRVEPRMVDFDPARFVVVLAAPPRGRAAVLPAPEVQ